jgi:hypothetical protein
VSAYIIPLQYSASPNIAWNGIHNVQSGSHSFKANISI